MLTTIAKIIGWGALAGSAFVGGVFAANEAAEGFGLLSEQWKTREEPQARPTLKEAVNQ